MNPSDLEKASPSFNRPQVYSNTSTDVTTSSAQPSKPSNMFASLLVKAAIVVAILAVLYSFQLLNKIWKDKLDYLLSLYPRNWRLIWHMFTCVFIHDDFKQLNCLVAFFAVCAFCVILQGNLLFLFVSLFVIVLGNLLSWIFGSGRMNGVSALTCGYLGYIYFSVITDLGYPVKWSAKGVKTLLIAVVVTVLFVVFLNIHWIPTTTACWQYNVCGFVCGVVSAFVFTTNKAPPEPVPQETPEGKKRVMVADHLISFNDLRNPLM